MRWTGETNGKGESGKSQQEAWWWWWWWWWRLYIYIYIEGTIYWKILGSSCLLSNQVETAVDSKRSAYLWLQAILNRSWQHYTRMLRAILNRSWQQHPTRWQLYGHLPPITKTIQARRTRHAGHCWKSKDEIVSAVLLWTPAYGQSKAGRPARTFIQQLCDDTGCKPEDLPKAMNDRETWRERVRDLRASRTSWWWWYSFVKRDSCKSNFADPRYCFSK